MLSDDTSGEWRERKEHGREHPTVAGGGGKKTGRQGSARIRRLLSSILPATHHSVSSPICCQANMSATTAAPQLPQTMRGLVIEKFAGSADEEKTPYTFRDDLPLPALEPHHVLLKIATSGYCHTEGMVVRGEFQHMMRQPLPLIPSHEPTGVVVALGSEAANMSRAVAGFSQGQGAGPVATGDRVGAIAFANFCGKCDDCKAGNIKYCADQDFVGVTFNGGFAECVEAVGG